MGLIISVLRSAGSDCSNNGVSAKADNLVVVNVDGPFKPRDDMPAVALQQHVDGCLRLVPVVAIEGLVGWQRPAKHSMMGGNFGHTSDSRFSEACERLLGHRFYGAVAIHDRVE